jgi:twitching motility protein PilT
MQYEKLIELLARPDVKELALQTDRPPCALIGEGYKPIVQQNLTEDDVIAAAIEAGGRTEVLHLLNGARKWDFEHPIGMLRISAGYHGSLLQVRIRLVSPAVGSQPISIQNMAPVAPPAPPAPRAAPERTARTSVTRDQPAPAAVARKTGAQGLFDSPRGPEGGEFGADMPPLMGSAGARAAAPAAQPASFKRPKPAEPPAAPAQAKQNIDDLFSEPPPVPDGGGYEDPANDVGIDDTLPVASDPPPRLSAVGGNPAEMFEQVLALARQRQASDLHILADRPVMLRIAGDLVPHTEPLTPAFVEAMLLPVVPERVKHDLHEHGACDFALSHPTLGRFRCNATRQRTGYKLTARPIGDRIPTLADLGLPEAISAATEHHQGLIVVTGPTGHGKTTTLAAIVDIINRTRPHHIITVEDPVEYVHPRKMAMMSQREVGTNTKTFAAALKGSLREDPDVIVVGELRDTDTVRMALSAAETGHLVISTMNTPSAAKAIERIIDLFPPGDQPQVRMTLAGGLRLVVSQRLVPTADRKSVVAAAELLPGSSALWALIRDNKTFQIPSLQQRGKALGIIRLDDSLAEHVRSGKVSLDVAKEFADSPDQLEGLVTGKGIRPEGQQLNANNIDPTKEAAQAAQKFGKDMLSKAGGLFGRDKK